jgi:hypothetical protein
MIRVGKFDYASYPTFDGFTPIPVISKSRSIYRNLSPFLLKDDMNRYMENLYQFSKVYKQVPKTTQRYSKYNPIIIWQHPKETHVIDNKITDEYKDWRKKGMDNNYPVRFPVGKTNRHKCLYSLKTNEDGTINEDEQLDYIESRKQIYMKLYIEIVKKHPLFMELKNKLANGENLLIIDIDGPYQSSLDYYKEHYNVSDDFIEHNSMLVNKENIDIMLHDIKHPFGHGYCLAIALLDLEII